MRKYQQAHLDQYYTDPNIAKTLLDKLFEFVPVQTFSHIIEPSAGNGSFSNILTKLDTNVIAVDIDPKHDDIQKLDFLTFKPKDWKLPNNPDEVLCVGNPPFQTHCRLAKQFIAHCATFSNHIAFILPQSILTKNGLNGIPPNFHPVFKVPIPGNPFIVDGKPYDKVLKTTFVYFQNLNHPRVTNTSINDNGNWRFLKKSDASQRDIADFRIIQNGGRSGKCILSTDDDFVIKNRTSKIFTDFYIQVNDEFKPSLKDIQIKLNAFVYEFQNLTTWKSLGKNRVAEALNSIII
jgi:hypothetical protein